MPTDLVLVWWILCALSLFIVGLLLFSLRKGPQQNLLFRFWQNIGLPMGTDTIAAAGARRIKARMVGMLLGAGAGLLISAMVLALAPGIASLDAIWLVVLPLVLTGQGAGEVVATLSQSLFKREPNVARIARPNAVTIHDYVSPRRLLAAPVLIVIALAACIVALCLGAAGTIDAGVFMRGPGLPLLAIALIVFGASNALERRVLNQPQPAASELELAWDDAFRAESFRVLRMLETMIAWLAVAAIGLGILQGLDALDGTTWAMGFGSQLFMWGYLPILIAFSVRGAQSYFRFRLWPDLTVVSSSPEMRAAR